MTRRSSIVLGATSLALCLGLGPAVLLADRFPEIERKEVAPAEQRPPCSTTHRLRYDSVTAIAASGGNADYRIEVAFDAQHMWGVKENISLEDGPDGHDFIRVRYPKGSINPSNKKAPLGGAGFLAPIKADGETEDVCLHYEVRFQDSFKFAKGGKLPGLYGGDAPSGGDDVSGRDGWSIRPMWRKEGKGELYEYVANKKGKYGASVGRGLYEWPDGRWVEIDIQTKLNTPGEPDGITRLWVDGKLIMEQTDVVFRTVDDIHIDGIMFSTFFGGSSKAWKSPKDQHADFRDFKILTKR